jgi:hypothetical protein
VCASPSDTRGRSRVPELGSLGSVRGAFSNERPYRELAKSARARADRPVLPRSRPPRLVICSMNLRDAPTSEWSEKLRVAGLSEHVIHHLTVMTEVHRTSVGVLGPFQAKRRSAVSVAEPEIRCTLSASGSS